MKTFTELYDADSVKPKQPGRYLYAMINHDGTHGPEVAREFDGTNWRCTHSGITRSFCVFPGDVWRGLSRTYHSAVAKELDTVGA